MRGILRVGCLRVGAGAAWFLIAGAAASLRWELGLGQRRRITCGGVSGSHAYWVDSGFADQLRDTGSFITSRECAG